MHTENPDPAPEPIYIEKAETLLSSGQVSLSAIVKRGEVQTQVQISYPDDHLPEHPGDALAVWFVTCAMKHGCSLHLEDEVSSRLLENLTEFQKICVSLPCHEGLQVIDIHPGQVRLEKAPEAGLPWIAAFGGGVDGWRMVLKHKPSIDSILFVHGIDREVIDPDQKESMNGVLRDSAQWLERGLIDVESNLRQVLVRDLGGQWDHTYIMATVGMGHLLSHRASRLVMAGDNSSVEIQSNRTARIIHPVALPFLSSDLFWVDMLGIDELRHEKVAWLAHHHPDMIPLLRVCYAEALGAYQGTKNCGVCEKCIRTLTAFRIAGQSALAEEAFDQPLDLEKLKQVGHVCTQPLSELKIMFYINMYRAVLSKGDDPELAEALRIMLEESWRSWPKGPQACWDDPFPRWRASPAWSVEVKAHPESWVPRALESLSDDDLEKLLFEKSNIFSDVLLDHHLLAKMKTRVLSSLPGRRKGRV